MSPGVATYSALFHTLSLTSWGYTGCRHGRNRLMLLPLPLSAPCQHKSMMSKILVIEDQADIRRLIRWSLEDTGHSLHEAPNGTQGLELALSLRPNLVFLDVMMPGGLGGIEVCAQMRADPALAHTVIVMLTADSAQQTRTRALEAGANYFLAKPFSPAKLLELTETLLSIPSEPEADAEAP